MHIQVYTLNFFLSVSKVFVNRLVEIFANKYGSFSPKFGGKGTKTVKNRKGPAIKGKILFFYLLPLLHIKKKITYRNIHIQVDTLLSAKFKPGPLSSRGGGIKRIEGR